MIRPNGCMGSSESTMCNPCPYDGKCGECLEEMRKSQDKTVNTWHHLWDAPDGSFKARCGNCGFVHFFVQGLCSQYRFCPKCGEQKVI